MDEQPDRIVEEQPDVENDGIGNEDEGFDPLQELGKITGENQDEATEEEAEEKTEEPESEEGKKEEQPVVTEKMAEKYPYMKDMVGKPIEEVAKAYENLQKKLTQVTQEKKIEKEKIPDPLDEPEKYDKYRDQKVESKVEEIVERKIQETMARMQVINAIPDELDVEKTIKGFAESLKKNGKIPKEVEEKYINDVRAYARDLKKYAETLLRDAKAKRNRRPESEVIDVAQPSVSEDNIVSELMSLNYNPEDWK